MHKSILDRYEEADAAFRADDLQARNDDQLLMYLSGLSNQNNTNTGTQHRDIIRGLTINNILLKRHIDKLQSHISSLNAQNSRTQILVMALTIASLFGTGLQSWYAYRADAKIDQPTANPVEPAKIRLKPQASLAGTVSTPTTSKTSSSPSKK
jgi:signal transduction protein with GAF and PtsI domain